MKKILMILLSVWLCIFAAACGKETKNTSYSVFLPTSEYGVVTSDKTAVKSGEKLTITVTPNEHYVLETLMINAQTVEITGNTYVIEKVTSNVTVDVQFAKRDYTISFGNVGTGGEASFDKTAANYGENVKLSVSVKRGYAIDRVTVNGEAYGAADYPEVITVTNDVVVDVSFVVLSTVTPNVKNDGEKGGYVLSLLDGNAPQDGKFYVGEWVRLTATAKDGYQLRCVALDGAKLSMKDGAFEFVLSASSNIDIYFDEPSKAYFYDGETLVFESDYFAGATLSKPDFTIDGYEILGFYTEPNCTGATYDFSTKTDAALNELTLYVKKKANEYRVAYYDGETRLGDLQNFVYDQAGVIRENTVNNDKEFFIGWSKTLGGKVDYKHGETVENLTPVKDGLVELYAVWGTLRLKDSYDLEIGETLPLDFEFVNMPQDATLIYAWDSAETSAFELANKTLASATVKNATDYARKVGVTLSATYEGKTLVFNSSVTVWFKGLKFYIPVYTANDFLSVDFRTEKAILMNDIDLGDVTAKVTGGEQIPVSEDSSPYNNPGRSVIGELLTELDGNGKTLTYYYRHGDGYPAALIGFLRGRVHNLRVNSSVRYREYTGSFAITGSIGSVVEDCYFSVLAMDDSASTTKFETSGGVFVYFSGTMKNCIVEFTTPTAFPSIPDDDALVLKYSQMHSLAYRPAIQTVVNRVPTYFETKHTTFDNVVVVTNTGRDVYNGYTTWNGTSAYVTAADYAEHDFSSFDEEIWNVVKRTDGTVAAVGLQGEKLVVLELKSPIVLNKDEITEYALIDNLSQYLNIYGDEAKNWKITGSDDLVVLVRENGTLEIRGVGAAKLTVTCDDALQAVEIPVTITGKAVSLDKTSVEFETGAANAQTVTVSVKDVVVNSYVWSIENGEGIVSLADADKATVKITGLKEGAAELKLTLSIAERDITAYVKLTVWNEGHYGYHAISTEEEFLAMDGKSGKYYLAENLSFTDAHFALRNGTSLTYEAMSDLNAELDGNGKTVTVTQTINTEFIRAFIYNLNGRVYDLNFISVLTDKNIRQDVGFAYSLNLNAIVENCTFDMTVVAAYASAKGEADNATGKHGGVFFMTLGTFKDSTITFKVMGNSYENQTVEGIEYGYHYHAIAQVAYASTVMTGITVITEADRPLVRSNSIEKEENYSVTVQAPKN